MNRLQGFFLIMAIIMSVVAYIAYHVIRTPDRITIYRENPPTMDHSPAWGYKSHSWWRRYDGIPGMGRDTPHSSTVTAPAPGRDSQ